MKIEHQQVGSVAVMTVKGALIEDDATRFAADVKKQAQGANARLVLDLHEVPYVDSTALEGLLDVADVLDQRSVRLRLASLPGTVREVLQLTGLSQRFEFFEKVEDAVRSFL